MKRSGVFGGLLGCCLGLVGGAAEPIEMDLDRQTPVEAGGVIPITDFFRPAYMSAPTINLAGTHLAALVTGGSEKPQLMVINLADGSREIVSGRADKMVYAYRWLGNEHIAFHLSMDKRFDLGLMVAKLSDLDDPYPINQYGFPRVIGVPRDNPLEPVVWVRGEGLQRSTGLYQLKADLNTGPLVTFDSGTWLFSNARSRVTESNSRNVLKKYPEPSGGEDFSYMPDRHGNLMLAYTMEHGEVMAHLWDGQAWTPSPVDLNEVELFGPGDRWGEVIAQREVFGGERAEVRRLDMRTGEWGESLLADADYDFTGYFYRDPGTLNLVGAIFDRAGPAVRWFSQDYVTLQKLLENAFPSRVVRIKDADERGENLVVHVSSDRQPTEYYLVNLEKKQVDLIARSRPWLDPTRLRPMNIIQFKTAEGQPLDAYVTMPEGASKETPPPLLVIPHGGPWVRDTWGFDNEAQFWASRGYAVLQPNYRGSSGSNWKFPRGDRFEFLKMHDDVTRATRTLIRSGYVDPGRIAIMGASFGGYLALSGAVYQSDLYQCAVTFAGVFDWEQVMEGAKRGFEREKYGVLRKELGDPKAQREKFERISPVRHVDQIKIPVFVAHGKDDKTALVGESKRLIRELETHGVEHEAWLIRNEGHGTAELANRVELITRMEAFLKQHL